MSTHDPLSPSGFKAHMMCLARFPRTFNLPPGKDSIHSLTGTTAHELLENWLCGISSLNLTTFFGKNGVDLNKDQIEKVKEAYAYLVELINSLGPCYVQAESKVDPGIIWNTEPVSRGTLDVLVFELSTGHLYIFDYKNGFVFVDVHNNVQLDLYVLGAITALEKLYPDIPVSKVTVGILQPNSYNPDGPFRIVELNRSALYGKRAIYQQEADRILKAGKYAIATPSEESCRYCKTNTTCRERAQLALTVINRDPTPLEHMSAEQMINKTLVTPQSLNDEELKRIMDASGYIKTFLKDIEKHVTERLHTAKGFTGYKLVAGRRLQVWTEKEEATIQSLKNLKLTEGDYIENKLKSPAQMGKVAKSLLHGDDLTEFKGLIHKTDGKPTPAPESDKRKAIMPNAKSVLKPIVT